MKTSLNGGASSSATTSTAQESEGEFALALQMLSRKLRDGQPSYFDDDVVHPNATSIPLHHSPPRTDDHASASASGQSSSSSPSLRSPKHTDDRMAALSPTLRQNIHLEKLSIFEMVAQLDAKQIWRTRRSVSDVSRIILRAFDFAFCGMSVEEILSLSSVAVERSDDRLTRATSSCALPNHNVAAGSASPPSDRVVSSFSSSRLTPPTSAVVGGSSKSASRVGGGGAGQMSIRSVQCLSLLDDALQSLLVYANESEPIRSLLHADREMVLLCCIVCIEARRHEIGGESAVRGGGSSRSLSIGVSATRPPLRSIREVSDLVVWLRIHNIPPNLAQTMVDVYALEMLLDAALPPSVCSSRYDGVLSVVWEKKAQLASDLIASRTLIGAIVKKATVGELMRLAIVGLYAPEKSRMRLFDKLTTEGTLYHLQEHIKACVQVLHASAKEMTSAGVSANTLLHESLDLLLCITSIHSLSSAVQNDDGVGSRARSTSRSATAPRVAAWTAQGSALKAIVADLLALVDTSIIPDGNFVKPPHGGNEQQRYARRPPWLSTALVDKVNELLVQLLQANADLVALVVEALDASFDHVWFRSATLLLPTVLSIVSNAATLSRPELVEIVAEWFSTTLTYDMLPWLFVQRKPWSLGRILSSFGSPWGDALPSSGSLAMVRHIERDEERVLLPFITFAKRLVSETSWRRGTTSFLKRVLLLCKSVVQVPRNCRNGACRTSLVCGCARVAIRLITAELEAERRRDSSTLRTVLRPQDDEDSRKRARSEGNPTEHSPAPAVALDFTPSPLIRSPPAVEEASLSPAATVARSAHYRGW